MRKYEQLYMIANGMTLRKRLIFRYLFLLFFLFHLIRRCHHRRIAVTVDVAAAPKIRNESVGNS